MVSISYIFLIYHSFQMTPKIEIKKDQIRGSRRPLNWFTSTNPCIWKYLIQVLSHLNTIMRWGTILLESYFATVSCVMLVLCFLLNSSAILRLLPASI